MTTVAWDGTTLAADRQSTYAGRKILTRKIRDCGEFWYAGCGEKADIEAIAEWIASGAPSASRPSVDEGGLQGLAIRKADARAFTVEGKRPTLCAAYAKHVVAGSGSDYAVAAMSMGKTAAQAVCVAARFDVFTGLGVDSVRIVTEKKKRK